MTNNYTPISINMCFFKQTASANFLGRRYFVNLRGNLSLVQTTNTDVFLPTKSLKPYFISTKRKFKKQKNLHSKIPKSKNFADLCAPRSAERERGEGTKHQFFFHFL